MGSSRTSASLRQTFFPSFLSDHRTKNKKEDPSETNGSSFLLWQSSAALRGRGTGDLPGFLHVLQMNVIGDREIDARTVSVYSEKGKETGETGVEVSVEIPCTGGKSSDLQGRIRADAKEHSGGGWAERMKIRDPFLC